ncbi:MAG: T9SS type A sorting domain-containing protein [Bacteroidetes bacterium]|nr:T9SS type A sorting domain-containing protein [Bacteroidota bacterium]MBU1720608.1 T9SS type A sorting domain-containing protein [Bacteroidota bacterium]
MKKGIILLTMGIMILSTTVFQTVKAQNQIRQIIAASGGMWEASPPFSDYVSVASLDPVSMQITTFDTIFMQSVTDLAISGNYAFVAAGDSLKKYNIDTYSREAAIGAPGINQLEAWNDKLIATFQWGSLDMTYVKVFNMSDLSVFKEYPEVSDESFGIVVAFDTAYISVPGGWAATEGKYAMIDMQNDTFLREISLDTLGQGMRDIFYADSLVMTMNTMTYGATYGVFSSYNVFTGNTNVSQINLPFGNGFLHSAFSVFQNKLYGIINNTVGTIDYHTGDISDTALFPFTQSIAEAVLDTNSGNIYLNYTDFFSFGAGNVYNNSGDSIGTYDLGISPEAMAIDYRSPITTVTNSISKTTLLVYPIPASEMLTVEIPDETYKTIQLIDVSGNIVLETKANSTVTSINISEIPSGMYLLTVRSTKKAISKPIIVK